MNKLPLVVILGATGSGKTKLSLELAKRFGGEIIGADSMQLYKGLDVATAKATKEERNLAAHHLIDILDPQDTFTVIQYRNKALQIIDNLLNSNKLPIVVGGTNYYIESILWKILVDNDVTESHFPLSEIELPSEALHAKLNQLDPAMAKRLHPNNKRKILRALEVLYKKGRKLSEILEEQQSARDASHSGGGLRYQNSLVLWLQCDKDLLSERIDARVESMIREGLLKELINFHQSYNVQRSMDGRPPDYTKGVFQSIGFKEFHPFLTLRKEERGAEEGIKRFQEGIQQLKLVTRRYAKKQNKWITNRFLGRSDRKVPPIYGLDTSDISKWTENVSNVAEEIIESYISGRCFSHETIPKMEFLKSVANSEDDTFRCEVCDRVFIGNFQWSIHLRSNKHKRQIESRNRRKHAIAPEDM